MRSFEENDTPQVLMLHKAGLQQMGVDLGSGPWDDDLNAISKHYLQDGGTFLIGQWEDEIIAMGALRRLSVTDAEIKRIRVRADYQGRGFGRAILAELERHAMTHGYKRLRLDTTSSQKPALSLFASFGYREIRRERGAGWDSIFMEKVLE